MIDSTSARRWKLAGIWSVALVVMLYLSWLIPPAQSPDEHAHIARAEIIANGHLGLDRVQGGNSGGLVDESLVIFMGIHSNQILSAPSIPDFANTRLLHADNLRWSTTRLFYPTPGTGYYLPVVYFPHALGLRIGKALDWTVANSYRLCRLLALLTTLAVLAGAFHLVSPTPLALALLTLPMSLFQAAAPVIDGLTTSLAVLAISLAWRGMDLQADWRRTLSLGLCICLLVLVGARAHLLPMLLFPLAIAWVRRSGRDLWLGLAAMALVAIWLVYALTSTQDSRIERPLSTIDIAHHYLANPSGLVGVFFNTLNDAPRLGFYATSFVGNLGWLDTPLPEKFYVLLGLGLLLCAAVSFPIAHRARPTRALMVFTALSTMLLVFLAMLLTWTPHPASYIEGVQGRYLLIPALLMAGALQTRPSHLVEGSDTATQSGLYPLEQRWRWVTQLAWPVFLVVSLGALIPTLLARYHGTPFQYGALSGQ